jgi:asparagine synthase (glutamine-hydrolysing)
MFIGGVFDPSMDERGIKSALERMIKINCFGSIRYNISTYAKNGFGLVHIAPRQLCDDPKIQTFDDCGITIALQGDVDGESLRSIATMYRDNKDGFINTIDGHFNIAIFEHKTSTLNLYDNRTAVYGMYYLQKDDSLYFGNTIKSILMASSQKPEIDELSLMQRFHFGHSLDDRTLFKSVKHLPAASVLRFNNKMEIDHYWKPEFRICKRKKTATFIKEFNDMIQKAVNRKLRNKKHIGLSLSGGLDSRVLVAACELQKIPLKTVTYGRPDTNDVKYGQEIAARLGYDNCYLDMGAMELSGLIPFICWQVEGNIPFSMSLSPFYHKILSKENISYKVGGACGDALSGSHIEPVMLLPLSQKFLTEWTFEKRNYMGKALFSTIFQDSFLDTNKTLLRKSFADSIQRINEKRFADKFAVWDLTQRQERFIFSSSAVDRYYFTNITCFVDKDLLDFWFTVPLRLRFFQMLYKKAILKLSAKIADVPWAWTGHKIQAHFLPDFSIQLYEYLKRKFLKIWNRRKSFNKKTDWLNMAELIRKDMDYKKKLEGLIDSRYCPETIFDREGIATLIDGHYSGRQDNSRALNAIMSFCTTLKMFENMTDIPEDIESFVQKTVSAK